MHLLSPTSISAINTAVGKYQKWILFLLILHVKNMLKQPEAYNYDLDLPLDRARFWAENLFLSKLLLVLLHYFITFG